MAAAVIEFVAFHSVYLTDAIAQTMVRWITEVKDETTIYFEHCVFSKIH